MQDLFPQDVWLSREEKENYMMNYLVSDNGCTVYFHTQR
jgi:hypothetical protein